MDNENGSETNMSQDTVVETAQAQSTSPVGQTEPIAQSSTETTAADYISEHKLYAVLGYILPFLFFLPLLQESSKHNAFARFHANQQLILLIVAVGLYAIHNILFIVLMGAAFFVVQLLNLAILILAILGIVAAVNGQMKELPVIGKFNLLK